MKPKDEQFKTCNNCGRPITGKIKSVNTNVGGTMHFHESGEDCAGAPDKSPKPRVGRPDADKRRRAAMDWTYE